MIVHILSLNDDDDDAKALPTGVLKDDAMKKGGWGGVKMSPKVMASYLYVPLMPVLQSSSSQFSPRAGSSRGLLRDYETSNFVKVRVQLYCGLCTWRDTCGVVLTTCGVSSVPATQNTGPENDWAASLRSGGSLIGSRASCQHKWGE